MCGIAGFINLEQKVIKTELLMQNMLNKIAHRGPDGDGIWVSESNKVIFGHKRLSIIDLNINANQPMIDNNGHSIVFNGEIYNHHSLRKELESNGVSFATAHSDTEVLLRGYAYWGIDTLLSKINGMFAFAIHDENLNKVIIARDRVGIKSLYYTSYQGQFVFCSEIKGILETRLFKPELDDSKLNEYLLNRSLKAPNTLFKNVFKLEPAHYIVIDENNVSVEKTEYWSPLNQQVDSSIKSQIEVEETLSTLIDSSLDFRLEADVPVGMFLSGGVDSNYLLSRLSEKRSGIKCFNASFPDDNGYDESADAKRMAMKFNAEFIDVPVGSDNYLETLEKVVYFQEEPISAPVCVPVYLLSQAAKQHGVPVVLAGEGSDELFIGYNNWINLRKAQGFYNKLPFGKKLSKVAQMALSSRLIPSSPVHDVLHRACSDQPLFWGGAMELNANLRKGLLSSDLSASKLNDCIYDSNISGPQSSYMKSRDKSDISSWMVYMDLNQRLPELMLPRLDRMGMAHSIEGRVPYLDHRIIEYIFSVPERVMVENKNIGKSALKAIAAKTLGRDFVYRRKKGFQAPVSEWKNKNFNKVVELLEIFAERTGIFSIEFVKMVTLHGGRRYFTLINFMLWYLVFIENVLRKELPTLKSWEEY